MLLCQSYPRRTILSVDMASNKWVPILLNKIVLEQLHHCQFRLLKPSGRYTQPPVAGNKSASRNGVGQRPRPKTEELDGIVYTYGREQRERLMEAQVRLCISYTRRPRRWGSALKQLTRTFSRLGSVIILTNPCLEELEVRARLSETRCGAWAQVEKSVMVFMKPLPSSLVSG